MTKENPIGFLDSGVGGLTVVKEALRQLPNETIYYIGDTARCPYGPRPVDQIKDFTWDMVNFLLEKKVKMIVIACNTATAVGLDEIRAKLDIPVVGVIKPGSRASLKVSQTQKIGVIGTVGTVNSKTYTTAIHAKAPKAQVIELACPKFVPIVESMEYTSAIAKRVVKETLQPLKDLSLDTLILGCTHYPLLKQFIQQTVGDQVTLVDSGVETVSEVSMLLDYYDISAKPKENNTEHRFYMTGSKTMFDQISQDWLEQPLMISERITFN
ncbi:glutamate racemase [Vagococcus penaei]|uniref:Glutamate racemase n=1 Tax=Vagococcus penaei TaxID=633807 RepID=A0A1Q2D859_9ENTE|nr:glutamate racemase [Vagococcus penaei]AQP54547.1 glutamate racemase [Vagococcus penaei]RSU06744.1 glutamate racemase [Vagococcus penaei]